MPAFVKTAKDEERWSKAKAIAAEEYNVSESDGDRYWKIVNGIYQRMNGKVRKSLVLWKSKGDRHCESLAVQFNKLTSDQRKCLIKMFGAMLAYGHWGHSTLVGMFVDGDGDFHAEITCDGKTPAFTSEDRDKFEETRRSQQITIPVSSMIEDKDLLKS